jgi:hypothetical protein
MWKEQVRQHKIDKVRYLLYGKVVCSVDGILTDSFCKVLYPTRMEQN